jgi:hypothetical protein
MNVRLKHIDETSIKDIAFHPQMWANDNNYAVYVCNDNKVRKIRVELEFVYYKLNVSSMKGESKLLNLVATQNGEGKLILLQI